MVTLSASESYYHPIDLSRGGHHRTKSFVDVQVYRVCANDNNIRECAPLVKSAKIIDREYFARYVIVKITGSHIYAHKECAETTKVSLCKQEGHAPHVWLSLAHTPTTPVPPSLHCYMLSPAASCQPPQPCTSYCCSHAHIIRPGTCLPSQLLGGVLPSLLCRVLWVQKGQVDNASFLFLWQATAQPLRPCFMGSPFRLTSSFGTQHCLVLTHLSTSR